MCVCVYVCMIYIHLHIPLHKPTLGHFQTAGEKHLVILMNLWNYFMDAKEYSKIAQPETRNLTMSKSCWVTKGLNPYSWPTLQACWRWCFCHLNHLPPLWFLMSLVHCSKSNIGCFFVLRCHILAGFLCVFLKVTLFLPAFWSPYYSSWAII